MVCYTIIKSGPWVYFSKKHSHAWSSKQKRREHTSMKDNLNLPFHQLTYIVVLQVITRKDVKLRVRHIPPPSARRADISRAIFFVHGVAGSSDIWTAQLSYFSERGYHVIAPDLIGHGMSSAPNKHKFYTFGWICHDCITVFDQFYQDINIVVGHSYG